MGGASPLVGVALPCCAAMVAPLAQEVERRDRHDGVARHERQRGGAGVGHFRRRRAQPWPRGSARAGLGASRRRRRRRRRPTRPRPRRRPTSARDARLVRHVDDRLPVAADDDDAVGAGLRGRLGLVLVAHAHERQLSRQGAPISTERRMTTPAVRSSKVWPPGHTARAARSGSACAPGRRRRRAAGRRSTARRRARDRRPPATTTPASPSTTRSAAAVRRRRSHSGAGSARRDARQRAVTPILPPDATARSMASAMRGARTSAAPRRAPTGTSCRRSTSPAPRPAACADDACA